MHLGDDEQLGILEVAPQLRAVGGFAHQVEFVAQIFGKLGDDFPRLEAAAFRPQLFEQDGGGVEEGQVMGDDRCNAGAQDFDCHFGAVRQLGEVHLGDGRGGDRLALEADEDFVHRLAVGGLQLGEGFGAGERRDTVLQPGQLFGDGRRQQVAAGGQHLAELDEDRPEGFERLAQAGAAGLGVGAAEAGEPGQPGQPTGRLVGENHLVEAVFQADGDDLDESEEAHGGRCEGKRGLCP